MLDFTLYLLGVHLQRSVFSPINVSTIILCMNNPSVKQSNTLHPYSFSSFLQNFTIDQGRNEIMYKKKMLADEIKENIVHDLIVDLIENNSVEKRITAARELGYRGTNKLVLGVLIRVIESDDNLQVRATAQVAIEKIVKRLEG